MRVRGLTGSGSDRAVGLMDKASASGAGDSRFKSWAAHCLCSLDAQDALVVTPACCGLKFCKCAVASAALAVMVALVNGHRSVSGNEGFLWW